MSTPYVHVDFVCINDYSSQRARELSTSAARSHASKVTYLKKRKPTTRTATTRPPTAQEQDHNKSQVELQAILQLARVARPVSSSILTTTPYAVNYYLDNVVPNLASAFHVFGVKPFWSDQWLRYVSKEPYYSAFAASQQLNRDSCSEPNLTTQSVRLLEHKQRAIQSLRQQLADGIYIDNTALLAMLKLAFIEAQLGDGPHYDMHRNAVRKLVQDQRGVENPDEYLAPMMSAHDLYRRMQADFPALPAPQVLGPAAESDLLTEIAAPLIERLPRGFQRLATNGKLRLELVRALSRTQDLLIDRTRRRSVPTAESQRKNDLQLAKHAAHDSFWTACPGLTAHPASPDTEPDIGNLLSLGIWLYVAMEFSTDPVYKTLLHWVSIARWTRQDLTNKLRMCVEIRSDDEESCLKWLINIAIQSWRDPNDALFPDGFSLNAFRKRRFVWLGDVDEDFFAFTKGPTLESPLVRSRAHRGLRTHSKIHVRSGRKTKPDFDSQPQSQSEPQSQQKPRSPRAPD